MGKKGEMEKMRTYIHGSDGGFILVTALIVLFCIFLGLSVLVEVEYSRYRRAYAEYVQAESAYNLQIDAEGGGDDGI